MKILVINPGSTSTKLSIYEDDKELFTESVFHDAPVLCKFKHVNDQLEFREKVVYDFLSKHSISFTEIGAIACRGGSAYPQKSGVIKIGERLYDDCMVYGYSTCQTVGCGDSLYRGVQGS